MKKHLLFAAILAFICTDSWSQIGFEEGYFIDESDRKVQCFIRNMDWYRNPTEFEYKLTNDNPVHTAGIQTVKEFGIPGCFKYIRATTDIDKSGDLTSTISTVREPQFQEVTVFLKVLVEGEASLFMFSEKNLTRYLFKTRNSEIEQLVYKRYMANNYHAATGFLSEKRVSVNLDFKNQLYSNFKNHGITVADIQNVNYQQRDLERFFLKVNGVMGQVYQNKVKKDLFNLSLRPGVNFHNLTLTHHRFESMNTDFGLDMNFRFGVEFEFILPFNKNKWGLIIEPTYRYYFPEAPSAKNFISKVNHKSIDIPAGIRHYLFLNDNSKLFVNAGFGYDFTNSSDLTLFFKNDGRTFDSWQIITGTYLAAGAGFKYKNRYSMEARYNIGRDILTLHKYWFSSYNTLFATFGYTLF